ncbi:ABC transporter permease [Paracoccus sediminicola]|uniref:ABC transporter permease n=1 Tax=Paracoccus sediminicola TaxID=3017783 RepID=UPI0022F09421|nr:ABC transporter permease [Paracoccus sediminicola]WBU57276.1 ABC transporter permease [Paracoccus sediminicola]
MIDLTVLVVMILSAATPLLFAALGELIVERSGVLNLGVEGMMIAGALAGFAAADATGNPLLGFAVAALGGAALSLIFGVLTQFLLTNHVATGLALTLFGLGLTALFGKPYEGVKAPSMAMGPFGLHWIAWAGIVAVPLIWWFLNRSRAGLILRGVGENHHAAHALGHKVRLVRLAAISFGGAMAGIGGAYISIATVLQWTEGMTAGAGWIALALVVFSGWRAFGVLAGAWLFGGVTVSQLRMQAAGIDVPVQLLAMAPYIATIVALVVISARRKGSAAPGSLGKIFHATS